MYQVRETYRTASPRVASDAAQHDRDCSTSSDFGNSSPSCFKYSNLERNANSLWSRNCSRDFLQCWARILVEVIYGLTTHLNRFVNGLRSGRRYHLLLLSRYAHQQRAVSQVVAASSDLSPGVTLAAKDLMLVDWPTEMALAGSFSKIEDVAGRPLLYPMGVREPILKRDLAAEGSGIGLASKIPTGMRATAVR